uniref:Protein kinase domain-containing protein n=1 Tax=Panagrolaimus sp. PS1159 TaxID=55785 RepID=A0AC35F3H4_9BILA
MKIVPAEENIRKEKEVLKIALKSNSVHLCKIIDSGYDNDMYFIVLDLLGSNLFTFNHQCSRKMNYKLAEQCLIAIEAFHALGYIHRDIKSDNFALGRKNSETEYIVYIIDFGMCRKLDQECVVNKEENYKGTLEYGSIAAKKGLRIGRKHDLESWFYMIAEWFIGYDQLPWQKSPVEYLKLKEKLRDDNSKCFKDFFGEYEKLPVEFKLSVGREFVAPPKDLAFFSSIDYNNAITRYRNIEHHGVSLNVQYPGRIKGKITCLVFKCTRCINSDPCGLKVTVEYNDEARLWDEAKVIKIKGDMDKCNKLQKLSKTAMLEDIKELKSGDKLESWKIVKLRSGNLFNVVNFKKNDNIEYTLKAVKTSTYLEKFRNEKRVLMEITESDSTKLCKLFDDGEKIGYTFLVMTLLGPDLDAIRLKAPEKKFAVGTTLSLGIECIEAIKELHSLGFVHNKITPKCFAVEEKTHRIILYDFEDATRIVTTKEDEEKAKEEDFYKPYSHYVASLPEPKNDLESLCYVMIRFVLGDFSLPDIKKRIPQMRQDMDGIPSAITKLITYIQFLPNSSELDYNHMKNLLMEGLETKDISKIFCCDS